MTSTPLSTVESTRFRRVLGHFCTGVTVITSVDGEGAVGFACQAFAALSLAPPLVLFCPSRTSATWRRIERAGHFCVNVLAEDQRDVSRVFGRGGADKFAGVPWSASATGAPVLHGVLTWAACRVEVAHDAGDHRVVIGRVLELGECRAGPPLLFYRGRYTTTSATSSHDPAIIGGEHEGGGAPSPDWPEVVDTLLAWPRHTDWM